MKVGYFSRRFYSNSGGGEQCDVYIIEILRNLAHEVIIISEKKSEKVTQAKKRSLINKIKEEISELSFYLRKIKFLINCDLLIITGRSLSAALISIFFPNKLIHNIHGKTNNIAINILKSRCKFIFFWGNSYFMTGKPKGLRFKVDLLPSSKYLRKVLNSYQIKNVDKNSTNKNKILKILWVGRLEPIKDPFFFLDVLTELNSFNTNWNATIIGDGSLSDKFINTFNQLNNEIKLKIKIIGQVENSKIDDFYKNSDLLSITSRSENFPLVALESLMTSTPVLSVPMKNLRDSKLSPYINFSLERNPLSLAKLINTFHNNFNNKRVSTLLKKDILEEYLQQNNKLTQWLK